MSYHKNFSLQLEGGEPTVHPHFWDVVAAARAHPEVAGLVVATNAVRWPVAREALRRTIAQLGTPLLLKVSSNHHLLETDPHHIERLVALAELVEEARREGRDVDLVINLRRRRGGDDDMWVRERLKAAGLLARTNDFFLQRYGLAAGDARLEAPYLAGTGFTLYNPDGRAWGTDLVARAEAMARLP